MTRAQVAGALDTATAAVDKIGDMAAANGAAVADVGETAAESDITGELSGGGVAFGEFTKSVGLAVAAAQAALDKTLVTTAKALSETEINTVAVFEQHINDDDGKMDKGEVHIQKLPLTNYLMPTAYQWSRVYLEADMNVQEFNSRSGFNIQQKSFSANARIKGHVGFSARPRGGAGMIQRHRHGVDASFGRTPRPASCTWRRRSSRAATSSCPSRSSCRRDRGCSSWSARRRRSTRPTTPPSRSSARR